MRIEAEFSLAMLLFLLAGGNMVFALDYSENVGNYTISFALPHEMLVGTTRVPYYNGTNLNGSAYSLYKTSVEIANKENGIEGSISIQETRGNSSGLLDAVQYIGPMWNSSIANTYNYTYSQEGKKIYYIPNIHMANRTIDGKNGKIIYGSTEDMQQGYYHCFGIYCLSYSEAVLIHVYGKGNVLMFFGILDSLHVGANDKFIDPSPLPKSLISSSRSVANIIASPAVNPEARDPQTADEWFRQGEEFYNQMNYNKSISAFDRALDLDPGNTTILINEGHAFNRQENFSAAMAAYDNAISIDPKNKWTWWHKGRVLEHQMDFSGAVDAFDQAILIDPNFLSAWLEKGYAFIGMKGKEEDRLKAYNQAIKIDPKSTEAWLGKATTLVSLGRFADAYAAYDNAISIEPSYQNKQAKEYAMKLQNQTTALKNETLDPVAKWATSRLSITKIQGTI